MSNSTLPPLRHESEVEAAPTSGLILCQRLQELRLEHRDLDEIIEHMRHAPLPDDLMIIRLKKRKLFLKDRIADLERQLEVGAFPERMDGLCEEK